MDSKLKEEVAAGLSGSEKWIPTRFHYDEKGSKLFQKLMNIPEYYPTRCELEIISTHAPTILNLLNFKQNFNVVELGCGDGRKTLELLKAFSSADADFTFVPVDICKESIETTVDRMTVALPLLRIQPMIGDYFSVLEKLRLKDTESLYLCFGGTFGNLTEQDAMDCLEQIWKRMAPRDKILIGFDLQKDPEVISKAYNDPQGVTKAFNMNLLERIRTELDADLDLANFEFCSSYNARNGEVRSHLVSTCPQTFKSKVLDRSFTLEAGERILAELSRKFTREQIQTMAEHLNFKILNNFMDERNYYLISMWEKHEMK